MRSLLIAALIFRVIYSVARTTETAIASRVWPMAGMINRPITSCFLSATWPHHCRPTLQMTSIPKSQLHWHSVLVVRCLRVKPMTSRLQVWRPNFMSSLISYAMDIRLNSLRPSILCRLQMTFIPKSQFHWHFTPVNWSILQWIVVINVPVSKVRSRLTCMTGVSSIWTGATEIKPTDEN